MEKLEKERIEIGKKLTYQQKLFCEKYIECKGNATEAARLAGYSKKTAAQQASRLLKNVNILAYTHVLQKLLLKKTGLSKESVLLDLLEIKDRCMQAVPNVEWDYDEHAYKETGEFVFDSKGAISSLDKISKMCGFDKKNSDDENNENEINIVITGDKE